MPRNAEASKNCVPDISCSRVMGDLSAVAVPAKRMRPGAATAGLDGHRRQGRRRPVAVGDHRPARAARGSRPASRRRCRPRSRRCVRPPPATARTPAAAGSPAAATVGRSTGGVRRGGDRRRRRRRWLGRGVGVRAPAGRRPRGRRRRRAAVRRGRRQGRVGHRRRRAAGPQCPGWAPAPGTGITGTSTGPSGAGTVMRARAAGCSRRAPARRPSRPRVRLPGA